MFYIVNVNTLATLTYKNGDKISYASRELARSHADAAETMLGGEPCVVSETSTSWREVAPWFNGQLEVV